MKLDRFDWFHTLPVRPFVFTYQLQLDKNQQLAMSGHHLAQGLGPVEAIFPDSAVKAIVSGLFESIWLFADVLSENLCPLK